MTNMPEQIWVDDERPEGGEVHVWVDLQMAARDCATEYVRKDIADARVAAAYEAAAVKISEMGFTAASPSIRALATDAQTDALERVRAEAWRAGYSAGFSTSGEGWNGEFPYGDRGARPEDDPDWIETMEKVRAQEGGK
jgi:hypothetical protein